MTVPPKIIRKVLTHKITQLNDIIADLDGLLTQMETDFFRVSIFGSARLKPDTPLYQEVYDLAFQLAMRGCDIVTGGGPGLMEASNKGAQQGGRKIRSIGLAIKLPFQAEPNLHLDVKREHRRFSSRLDEFMRISHAVVVTPGGIGTLLEFFYTWQLIQVRHIEPRPIILVGAGSMWPELLDWVRKWPLQQKLMSDDDLKHVTFCNNAEEVVKVLEPEIAKFHKRKERERGKKPE